MSDHSNGYDLNVIISELETILAHAWSEEGGRLLAWARRGEWDEGDQRDLVALGSR
jgi:hypothetical protein